MQVVDLNISKNGVLQQISSLGHEQVVFCNDQHTGLKAIIAIHNTNLGPALGGTRMWKYDNEEEALRDVLRLSRGMTFKAAISGLELGGGKAVIIGDSSTEKTEVLMRKFGQFVDTLSGKYITAEDVGMTTKDMKYIRKETKYVTGIPKEMGGSGDPSPLTAYGVYWGMKGAAEYRWGKSSLEGRKILIQGVGNVGGHLLEHLSKEGAVLFINDINENKVTKVAKKYNAKIITDNIYDLDIDIYAPCALGATINSETIDRLKCSIIAGSANNQLANEKTDSVILKNKNIIYAPDFLISAGGLINVYSEIKGYNEKQVLEKTKHIYSTTIDILHKADAENLTTHEAALLLAKDIVYNKKK
ncbi:MAG: Glu/Leu/Phe/Val dehydrogenase [Bacteroidota bacterium]|nr:Glu/Leu/Phe/Val dehydrogenase [Bacteroidota bacterium]